MVKNAPIIPYKQRLDPDKWYEIPQFSKTKQKHIPSAYYQCWWLASVTKTCLRLSDLLSWSAQAPHSFELQFWLVGEWIHQLRTWKSATTKQRDMKSGTMFAMEQDKNKENKGNDIIK